MKFEDFKTCSQSGFCRRNRAYADEATLETSPYTLIKDSVKLLNNKISADIKNTETDIILTLDLTVLQDNTARVRINEKLPIKPRYDEHALYTLVKEPQAGKVMLFDKADDGVVSIQMDATRKIIIFPHPVRIQFLVNDEPVITFNDRGFFNFEHLRTKESYKPKMIEKKNDDGTVEMVEAETEKDLWEETFKTWTDPKPNGPESIGLDITFHNFPHVYGIPEHATSLSLKETRGNHDGAYTDPYRLYNTDVFEYALDSPTSLYGAVPLMVAHRKGLSTGIFWMNPSETWIDIVKTNTEGLKGAVQKVFSSNKNQATSTQTHWISEAGVLDVFVFFGPSTKDVLHQYSTLTGKPAMPQMFAVGYHQCRWNYINQRDVLEVDRQFDENDMPYDVIWLDIEYTDDKKYFTWDLPKFPNSIEMEEVLDNKGRKLVTIIDPHIKRAPNYYVCDEAKDKGLFVKRPDGSDYEAWCWPGQSSWVDFVHKESYDWWKKQFRFDKFKGTRGNVHIWNDMNEPSVFNGPEITIQKEMIHDGRWENRVLHNLYAFLSHSATADGVRERITDTESQKRPFVLSRGFYAGVQRVGPIWTGDNIANWESLRYTNPMILGNSMGGVPFTGADVPGFFNNPTPELLTRWYQAGAYQPFFRGHAHIDTKRREPYLSAEPYKSITRDALRERYALLSYWYTLFYDAYKNSTPMMRPMFMEFPDDETVFDMDDQFMVGESILVKPVTTEGTDKVEIYFPGNEPWYNTKTFITVAATNGWQTVDAPLDTIPAYYQGGHIIPRRERIRRSSPAMRLDPFTLIVAKSQKGDAVGTLYMDDEETYAFEKGAYTHTQFVFDGQTLQCSSLHEDPTSSKAKEFAQSISKVRVERIRILGQKQKPSSITIKNSHGTTPGEFEYDEENKVVVIKDPKVSVTQCDWSIIIN
ncbi:glycosyl hydrolases family 31-domain-containing protein [Cokeromyces recurvatus]|uniref:glycosyl hydrolases family 31-domain-containing protein n=1 Tax=Cokeromyces recurvatus TaxID=90255 RepID=UPI00221E7F98|nr:glycosyl hydrolases family 31-domain-containing protein [Cokeromyces recurvatus]KAI7904128.1 glycosyl hydrolases family 31-domain-containing protein [Cokeromyces recurvatus]